MRSQALAVCQRASATKGYALASLRDEVGWRYLPQPAAQRLSALPASSSTTTRDISHDAILTCLSFRVETIAGHGSFVFFLFLLANGFVEPWTFTFTSPV